MRNELNMDKQPNEYFLLAAKYSARFVKCPIFVRHSVKQNRYNDGTQSKT